MKDLLNLNLIKMINSVYYPIRNVLVPNFKGELKMIPFELGGDLMDLPSKFRDLVHNMTKHLPILGGISYLTVDSRVVNKGTTHRRGGAHIDGNYIPQICGWGGSGGWKVGEGGRELSSEHHKLSYQSNTGGMLIVSDHPSCMAWQGQFEGEAKIGGDCSHLDLGEGKTLKPNVAYYGNSQFLHESLPLDETVHRNLVRITLPMDYPLITN